MERKDLVQIIKDNPGCVATIDNDCWWLDKVDPYGPEAPNEEEMSHEKYEEWREANRLARDGEVKSLGSGYGSGNCYGGDILQALAQIVGVKIQSV